MIRPNILKELSRQKEIQPDMIEKDYLLGWVLFGIANSSIGKSLAFKGGTALSKIYFSGNWRLSEDLDFTAISELDRSKVTTAIYGEIAENIEENSEITTRKKEEPYTNEGFFRAKPNYTGPIGNVNVKIEITEEKVIGPIHTIDIPIDFDYPKFSIQVYTLENIFAEKLRAIIDRGTVRDYYDHGDY